MTRSRHIHLAPGLARRLRILHLVEGQSLTTIARHHAISPAAVCRIVNWKSFANQDDDLRHLPKPANPGGRGRSTDDLAAITNPATSCMACTHFHDDLRDCSLGIPECLESQYREAKWCSAFALQPIALD
jgi:hypothetical protein